MSLLLVHPDLAAGVGALGVLSDLVAAWFLSPRVEETDSDVEKLKALIAERGRSYRFYQPDLLNPPHTPQDRNLMRRGMNDAAAREAAENTHIVTSWHSRARTRARLRHSTIER